MEELDISSCRKLMDMSALSFCPNLKKLVMWQVLLAYLHVCACLLACARVSACHVSACVCECVCVPLSPKP